MAIKLISDYAKRLGLPGFSSHQFSVSCETEVNDMDQVPVEVARLYERLQAAVDDQIQQTGFVPDSNYAAVPARQKSENVPHNRLQSAVRTNGSNGGEHWACSDKQKSLIMTLVTENNISRDAVDNTAQERFGTGVKQLNKLQASGLISELLEVTGKSGKRKGGGQ